MAYDTPKTRLPLQGALKRIYDTAGDNKAFASQDEMADALNDIREIVEDAFRQYRDAIAEAQKAELEQLRAAAKG